VGKSCVQTRIANPPSLPPASPPRTKCHDTQTQAMANRVREHWQTVLAAVPPHAHAAVVRTSGMVAFLVVERVLCIECVLYILKKAQLCAICSLYRMCSHHSKLSYGSVFCGKMCYVKNMLMCSV
jgi:hypothetical protein